MEAKLLTLVEVLEPRAQEIEKYIPFEIAMQALVDGYRCAGISSYKYRKLVLLLCPNKPKGVSPSNFILKTSGQYYYNSCEEVQPVHCFSLNKSKPLGLQPLCKVCHSKLNAKSQTARTAKYKASKLKRTPSWANIIEISKFYKNCPKGYHVDHIVPLNGELVSGLHVLNNLQYLTPEENIRKKNKFVPIA